MTRDPLDALRLPIVPVDPRPEFAAALRRRIEAREEPSVRQVATVRYFVDDLDAAVSFYCEQLGFEEELRPSPIFAMLYRGDLRLLLSVPGEPHVLPDGTLPTPGGWNRISLHVSDLDATVTALRARGVRFRSEVPSGVAVRQVLLEDPSGNPVELFEPLAGYHERS
jgi:catechol 2,3-dioxygenase-like lactoylglutathione lyase family enzyme